MQIAIKRMRGFVRVQLKLPLSGVFFLCDTGSPYALNFEEEMWPPLQKSSLSSFWPTIQPKLQAWLLKMSWYPQSEMATYAHASSCPNHACTFDHPDESTLNVSFKLRSTLINLQYSCSFRGQWTKEEDRVTGKASCGAMLTFSTV